MMVAILQHGRRATPALGQCRTTRAFLPSAIRLCNRSFECRAAPRTVQGPVRVSAATLQTSAANFAVNAPPTSSAAATDPNDMYTASFAFFEALWEAGIVS
ncbi:hypothetical protein J3459_014214 [Metarhizium acridum]|uniref:uncharacterized protein n=1 Tax=Metarhizium acridum TaxID=92637 RepID=UPI001C6B0578|nr:hypothetical protein J3459_014214 [Metarhizium acridum]KAG8416287.1 hypothetical protein J3458_006880 [Metarhizium acridum]